MRTTARHCSCYLYRGGDHRAHHLHRSVNRAHHRHHRSVTSRCCSVRFCRPRDAQGKVLKPAKNCTQGTDYDLNVWAGMPGATAVANRGAARTDIKACGRTPPSGATTMHAIMPCLLYWRHLPGSCVRGLHRCIILLSRYHDIVTAASYHVSGNPCLLPSPRSC